MVLSSRLKAQPNILSTVRYIQYQKPILRYHGEINRHVAKLAKTWLKVLFFTHKSVFSLLRIFSKKKHLAV
jgi:hypothetical protein